MKPGAGSRKPIGAALGARLVAVVVVVAVGAGTACAQDDGIRRMTAELVPKVERAVGLRFRRPPAVEQRSRDQVRAYLNRKLTEQLPPSELRGIERTYRTFGLTSDTADLRRLMLDLYSEQVAGFYDPDSSVLYIVRGAEPAMVRLVLAHELVHALQDQYTPLNAILKLRRQNDRQMAGQAVAEGQATLASLQALAPGADLGDLSGVWQQVREGIRSQQASMPVFAGAPRIIQEGLLFPYLAGADFVRSFNERRARPDEQPYGTRLPISTEQILHPGKYTARERPARVRLAAPPGDTLVYEDDFGEFESRIALESWGVGESDAIAAAAGWNGDRFVVLGSRTGTALVWVTAWDAPADAARFADVLQGAWQRRTRSRDGAYRAPGGQRRWAVERLTVAGVPVVRLADAPASWPAWRALPGVRVSR